MLLTYFSYAFAPILFVWAYASCRRRDRKYPPGPRGLPILGNILDIPMKNSWLVFSDWSRCYDSDIIHVEVFGKHICVVNSAASAKDLFDGRPHIYSDKEQSVMTQELSGWSRAWALSPYGETWRENRRLFQQHFHAEAARHHPKQTKAARRLLQLLLDAPEDFPMHVRYAAGSAILDVVYAFDARPGDERIALVERAVATFSNLLVAGIYLVDIFPILKHIPSWLPGARFKRQAAAYKQLVDPMFQAPYEQFKVELHNGAAQPCFLGALLAGEDVVSTLERDEFLMNLVGTTYAAGSDTTVAALNTFILAMVLHPKAQRNVQEELDCIVGRDRLPTMADKERLPQVMAVVYEVLRWHPPLPLATPHRAMSDDVYNGLFIPAGSVVFGNTWAMLHDPTTYPSPHTFDPDRFLTLSGTLRADVPFPTEAFGFGRRACPGRAFALDALFLAVAHVLTVFVVEHAKGANGPVEVLEDFSPHVLSAPEPFKAHFRLRFEGSEELIRSAAMASDL